MVGRALKGIDSITTPSGSCTNIIDVREEFVEEHEARFVPNVYKGIGMKWDHEWLEIIVILDSDTDIFDAYIDDDGPNLPIAVLRIDMTMIIISTEAEVTERWEYTPNKIYVSDRREGRIEEGSERQTFEYHLIAYDDKSVSWP